MDAAEAVHPGDGPPGAGLPGVPRPLWIGRNGAFAVVHLVPPAHGTGVVICSPFGWEEVACYRSRREWAEQLAAAGYPAVRFDWPGSGDAAGSPGDPQLVSRWCEALGDVTEWLRGAAGVDRIAVIGIGFGGLIAVEAARRGTGIDDLALWGAPRSGRAFVRGEQAFSALQSDRTEAHEDPALPEGWLESGGYLLSAETLGDLASIAAGPAPGVRRILLLGRDGIGADPAAEDLRAAGAEVRIADGTGYGRMVENAELTALPRSVVDQVTRWLDGAAGDGTATAERPATGPGVEAREALVLPGLRERVIEFAHPRGTAFGVLAEPDQRRPGAPTVVMLPAWATRRAGTNRIWATAARRWAARGIPVLRVDLHGVGDAEGDREWLSAWVNVLDPLLVSEVRAVLDGLEREGIGGRFVVCGISSGGTWALNTLREDDRVVGALVTNSGRHGMDPAGYSRMLRRRVSQLMIDPRWWWRVIRGRVRVTSKRAIARMLWRELTGRRRRRGGGSDGATAHGLLQEELDRLHARGAWLCFAFSEGEPVHEQLEAAGLVGELDRWPRISVHEIPGRDHDLRSLTAQQEVHRLLDQVVDAVLADPGSLTTASAG